MSVGASHGSLRGQMALKSSAFNPSSGKLCAQHMVIDHMNAHYKKLISAKSAIDAGVPKSHQSSQKIRDRVKREQISKSYGKPSRPPSARKQSSKSRPVAGDHELDLDFSEYRNDFTADEIDTISAMVSETYRERQENQKTARSGSSSGGVKTSRGMVEAQSADTGRRKKMSADVLDKRAHMFKEPVGEFTPRTLKTNKYDHVPSKLSTTKHFRPASRKSTSPPRRKDYVSSHNDTDIMDETILSRDFNARLSTQGTVPKLDISIDQDHMKWLKEQSIRSQQDGDVIDSKDRKGGASKHHSSHHKREPIKRQDSSHVTKMIEKEEEELCYLDFVNEVTNDILVRGIFTNRVLRNVFEDHIERNKHKLSETRMRSLLDTLREDLGIPRNDTQPAHDDHGMGTNLPAVRSQTRTTGFNGTDSSQYKHVSLNDKPRELRDYDKEQVTQAYSAVLEQTIRPDNQELADIREVSEATASERSTKSKIGSVAVSDHTNKSRTSGVKEKDDALLSLLGLEDVEETRSQGQASELSQKSGSKKYLNVTQTLDKDETESHKSSSTLEGENTTMKSQPAAFSEKSELVTQKKPEPATREKPKPAARQREPVSRQTTIDDEDDLESNADFGKTTLFARTTALGKTRPMSQGSDEGIDYKDEFEDDDDF